MIRLRDQTSPATMCRGSATLYGADALEQAALLSAVPLIFHTLSLLFSKHNRISPTNLVPNGSIQECSQKGDSGCASEKLGVPHLLSD